MCRRSGSAQLRWWSVITSASLPPVPASSDSAHIRRSDSAGRQGSGGSTRDAFGHRPSARPAVHAVAGKYSLAPRCTLACQRRLIIVKLWLMIFLLLNGLWIIVCGMTRVVHECVRVCVSMQPTFTSFLYEGFEAFSAKATREANQVQPCCGLLLAYFCYIWVRAHY